MCSGECFGLGKAVQFLGASFLFLESEFVPDFLEQFHYMRLRIAT